MLSEIETKTMWDILATPISGEVKAQLPADVRSVIEDFEKDYMQAYRNCMEAYLAALEWAMRSRDTLSMAISYLEAEQMRDKLGMRDKSNA